MDWRIFLYERGKVIMKIKKILWSVIFFILLTTPSRQVYAEARLYDNLYDIEQTLRTDDIRWRYKMINGELYKRKYNYTTNQWIGKWEKA